MIVRRATERDAEAIARVIATVAQEGMLGAEPPVDVPARAATIRELIAGEGIGAAFVLEERDEIVGHLSVRESASGVLRLGMAVLPGLRGRGGGGMLLARVIEHGLEVGAHKLELEAWVDNAPAIAFYSRHGFELEGIRREHYRRRDGHLRSTVVMARRLD